MAESGYCQCGCGKKTKIAYRTQTACGWIKGQPLRFIRGHNASIKKPVNDRFWVKVIKGPGCWRWAASVHANGYGQFGRGGRGYGMDTAHRMAWKLVNGQIPAGLCVLHRCDNRSCVNPDHLFLGTNKENTQDAISKGRFPLGEKSPFAKLKIKDVLKIRELAKSGLSHSRIALAFNVRQPAITRIVSRKRWACVQ